MNFEVDIQEEPISAHARQKNSLQYLEPGIANSACYIRRKNIDMYAYVLLLFEIRIPNIIFGYTGGEITAG
jgi:hypothetical protein